jgi:hypothetical protein
VPALAEQAHEVAARPVLPFCRSDRSDDKRQNQHG